MINREAFYMGQGPIIASFLIIFVKLFLSYTIHSFKCIIILNATHWNIFLFFHLSKVVDILLLSSTQAPVAQRKSNQYQFYSLWFKPTIYRTWGEHANHYTTDTVHIN